jgi:hypothetical protein
MLEVISADGKGSTFKFPLLTLAGDITEH